MTPCPSVLDLERYVEGRASAGGASAIEQHGAGCPTCASWLAEARRDEELLPAVTRAFRADDSAADPIPDRAPQAGNPSGLARYRFVRRLGTGGMGIVWEAEQASPRRRVALKLMKAGLGGPRARARFDGEVRLLGRLEHENIARIYEASTFEADGEVRSFFAMELVEGATLDRWVRERRPGRAERLRLFVAVARAVHHAHQKGVLHCDLKPANVLVTADGRAKVVDFGIARSLEQDDAHGPTQDGLLVGTLAYMAPEQVAGDAAHVDTRADVYGLGVLLYELLADARPHELDGLSLADAVRRIVDQDPPPLRTHVPGIDPDLDTIARTALAREKERRYPSAEALAADVVRWLERRPIAARPASAPYLFVRFVQRHRALAAGVGIALAALVSGLAGTTVQMLRARRAETAATERGAALLERTEELETERARLEQVLAFLVELLGGSNPDARDRSHDFTVREALDEASARLSDGALADPRVEATLQLTLGGAYRTMGLLDRAVPHMERGVSLRRAHEPGSSELAQALNELAALRWAEARPDEAVALWREALELYGRSDDPRDEARRATSLSNLAVVELTRGDPAAAEELARAALALHEGRLGRASHAVANDLALLANVVGVRGDPAQAERLLHEALAAHAAAPDPENLYTATTHWLLGSLCSSLGRFEEAAAALERSLEIRARILGAEHAEVRATERALEEALARIR